MNTDRAREIQDAIAIDATQACSPVVICAADEKPDFVFDADSWHSDCADYLIADTVKDNDRIREYLRSALRDIEDSGCASTSDWRIFCLAGVAAAALKIGFAIIKNAIKNGLTIDNVGEFSE